jgi:hypothetical protein
MYGAISRDQIYLAIVVWALLRQHMKFNLPGTTKSLLENPIDTLDQIIRMVTKWDGYMWTLKMDAPRISLQERRRTCDTQDS